MSTVARGVKMQSSEGGPEQRQLEPSDPARHDHCRDGVVDYYLRTAPFFEASAPKYAWLKKIVSVAIGERTPDGVTYEVCEIL